MSIYTCDICYAMVDDDDILDHKAWHRSLSPAPMREDHSGWPDGVTIPEHPDPLLSHERDPVAERAVAMVDCDHDWPPELYPDTPCTNCGMPYDVWDKTMRHIQ